MKWEHEVNYKRIRNIKDAETSILWPRQMSAQLVLFTCWVEWWEKGKIKAKKVGDDIKDGSHMHDYRMTRQWDLAKSGA